MSPIRPENRDRYPANWKTTIRPAILARAVDHDWLDSWDGEEGVFLPRCECRGECGRGTHEGRCPNVDGSLAYGTGSVVVLTVAHLDHALENCDAENLRAYCQACHNAYDAEHRAATRAETRRRGLIEAGQLELGEVTA